MATQILGDLGADVITVENAGGETNRAMGPGPYSALSGTSLNLLRSKANIAASQSCRLTPDSARAASRSRGPRPAACSAGLAGQPPLEDVEGPDQQPLRLDCGSAYPHFTRRLRGFHTAGAGCSRFTGGSRPRTGRTR